MQWSKLFKFMTTEIYITDSHRIKKTFLKNDQSAYNKVDMYVNGQ